MEVPAEWEEVNPPSDGDSSDSSEGPLVERRENNPRSSVGPTAARAPPDVRFEMQPAVFDAWLTLQTTLAKRSSALWRFHNWCIDNGLGPAVSATESMIYRYLQWLKEHGAPTTASSFLQAWTILHFHAGFLGQGVDALSSRVKGAARAMYSLERPLRQAYPLTVLMMVALENVATLAPYDHWRIIAGHMLLCLGSCSRFGDSIKLASLSVNSHNGLQIVEAESMSYTTAKKDCKDKLLPLIGLGRFFSKTPWAAQWMDLRAKHGLTLDPALPAGSEIKQDWLQRRMTTGEAHLFLKEFMASSGFSEEELDRIGCHSLKCTLLSWASQGAYLPISDRLLMGHHLSRENQSAVVYSRDELTRVTVVIYQMLKDVKNKRFKPDASRAERIAHQVDLTDSDSQASNSSDDEAGPEDVTVTPCNVGPRASWDDLQLDELRRLKVHAFSGVAHVTSTRDNHRFVCGRKNSKNYGLIPGGSNYADMPICMHCRR